MHNSEFIKMLNNIVDEETLQDNLSFTAFYIAVYENLACTTEERIKVFYQNGIVCHEDGTCEYTYATDYNVRIKKRVVDAEGNKNPLKASMLWLVDEGAITQDDYKLFLKIKEQRNVFAHELTSVIFRGNMEEEIILFFQMLELYQKIDTWWINEIEIPTSGEFMPGEYDSQGVESVVVGLYKVMIDVLYRGQSEKLKSYITEYMKKHGGDSDEDQI